MLKLDADQAFEFYRSFLEWYCRWHHSAGQPVAYLEIGCNRGDTCWRLARYCSSIDAIDVERYGDWDDPANKEKFPNLHFYKKTSDTFFSWPTIWGKQYDLIFIDGDHSEHQVLTDVHNCIIHLAPDGLIVLHDTFPPDLNHTGEAACGEAYKAIRELQNDVFMKSLQLYTFPVTFGVTLLAKQLVMPWLRSEPVLLAGAT